MNVFTDRNPQDFALELPLRCPIATFPQSTAEELQLSQPTWNDVIECMNDLHSHPSIELGSMFQSARDTEQPVDGDKRNTVQELITECKSDIQALNVQIPETFATLVKLCRELTHATCQLVRKLDQVSMAQYILSPPRHLPHDILEEIFFWSWESVESHDPRPHLLPMRLAAVCHRWRSVALSMPILWSRLRVNLNNETSICMAKAFIPRSRTLSLTLQSEPDEPISPADDFFDFIKGTPAHISRLSIESMPDDFPESIETFIEPFIRDCARDAGELVLLDTHYRMDEFHAPLLQRLFICFLPWRLPAQQVEAQLDVDSPQFHHLTVLHIRAVIPLAIAGVILGRCPQLQRLGIMLDSDGIYRYGADDLAATCPNIKPTDRQEHGHLEYLAISHMGSGFVPPTFLHGWTFPKLWTLSYEVRSWNMTLCCTWLTSHCSLLSNITFLILNYEDGRHSCDVFTSFIRVCPSVESLVLRGQCQSALEKLISIPDCGQNLTSSPQSPARDAEYSTFLLRLRRVQIVSNQTPQRTLSMYGDQLRSLRAAWTPHPGGNRNCDHHLAKFIIEVHTGEDPTAAEDRLSLLDSILDDSEYGLGTGDIIGNPRLEVQIHWNLDSDSDSDSLGRFWPLPFDHKIPKFGVLSDKGVSSTIIGPAYQSIVQDMVDGALN
ncbi:hypothetical protein BDN72DRAFT_848721 [Pluteus cervinus]|uniref:Uncharacterized protein n=1 Tax=Pluteus cervinus TaxID=181527 RepID=A0ACD3AA74_9AGAR|nr:hypothetical protein BDN72DRAFT_848721 [Pluteus cervinus]